MALTLITKHAREPAQNGGSTKHQALVRLHGQVAPILVAYDGRHNSRLLQQIVQLANRPKLVRRRTVKLLLGALTKARKGATHYALKMNR